MHDLDQYVSLDYPILIRKIQDKERELWVAEIPDLPGCISDGDTREEAFQSIEDAKKAWIETAIEEGRPIPKPKPIDDEDDYSGKFTLRLPKYIHKLLTEHANTQNVSLNQYVLSLICFHLGELNWTKDFVQEVTSKKTTTGVSFMFIDELARQHVNDQLINETEKSLKFFLPKGELQ